MKKITKYFIFLSLMIGLTSPVFAHHEPSHNPPPPPPPPPVVPVSTSTVEYEEAIPDCMEHYLYVTEVSTTYSDNTVSTARSYSVYNADGSVLVSNCRNAQHLTNYNGHYFIINNKDLIDSYGYNVTKESYVSLYVIAPDRIMASKNLSFLKAGYGVIDFSGNEIIPVKYQSIKTGKFNNGIYTTKLNGYYGLTDLNNTAYLKNEYDSIKELHYTYLIKKDNRYGLVNANGKMVLSATYNKIKKCGEYIIYEQNGKWGALDANGNILAYPQYKKIELNRNVLVGINYNNSKVTIMS